MNKIIESCPLKHYAAKYVIETALGAAEIIEKVYATDFTKLGVDVTQRWTTAQEQHNALSKAYYRGYYDAMKRINDHLEQYYKL